MSTLPKRVQAELDAATAAEAAYIQQRSEYTANAVPDAAELASNEPHVQEPVVTAPAPVAPEPPKPDFEHKFNVLQGMYKADVTRVKDQVSHLVAEIARLKEVPAAPAAPAQPDQKDIETFGADLIQMVQRYAEGQQEKTNARLDALEQRVGTVSRQTTANTERAFFDALRKAVPDFEEINVDDGWLVWLGQLDMMSGQQRQAALDDARAKGDVDRVAAIFNAYKSSIPAPVPQASMAEQITPQGAGNPPPVQSAPKQFITQNAINAFYRDVSRGVFDKDPERMAAIEANINLAVAEGRVR